MQKDTEVNENYSKSKPWRFSFFWKNHQQLSLDIHQVILHDPIEEQVLV